MNGIECAFEGRLGQDAELRYTAKGKALLSFSAAVDRFEKDESEPSSEWVKVAIFGDKAEGLTLAKGDRVYVEGRVTLNRWTGKDGIERSGLNVVAWRVELMGQIGRKAPPRQQAPGASTASQGSAEGGRAG